MNEAYLGLGSNLGDKFSHLEEARKRLTRGCEILKSSSLYETEAWGNKNQPSFYNQVIKVETEMNAGELMQFILDIEHAMGRERKEKWEPRIIDIDILFFNDAILHEEGLTVPHPHLHERSFVLLPLAEIDAAYVHPVFKKSISELLGQLEDDLDVRKVRV